MIGQGYQPEERTSGNLVEGDYLATIVNVEDKVSRSGNEMRVIEMSIPETDKFTFKAYLVQNEYFNANATELFDAFKIQRGNFNPNGWLRRQGYIHIRKSNPKDDGKQYWEFAWFVRNPTPRGTAPAQRSAAAQASSPASRPAPAPAGDGFIDDVPF